MPQSEPLSLIVWGELACFTNPIGKTERFSYPSITPSAARAIFEAVYWKPEFRWQVERIQVHHHPHYIALRRNEVKSVVPSTVKSWMKGKKTPQPLIAEDDRTQRQTIALKDVSYRIDARIVPWPGHEEQLPKMVATFKRRAARGQCVMQPYLGCREFPASFALLEDAPPPNDTHPTIPIGWMLYDVFDTTRKGTCQSPPAISVFNAQVNEGVLTVPPPDSPEVHRVEGEVR